MRERQAASRKQAQQQAKDLWEFQRDRAIEELARRRLKLQEMAARREVVVRRAKAFAIVYTVNCSHDVDIPCRSRR